MSTGSVRHKSLLIVALLGPLALLIFAWERTLPQAAAPRKTLLTNYWNWAAAPPDMEVHLTAALSLRHAAEMESLKNQLEEAGSPQFHKWLTSAEFERRFGPTSEQMKAVTDWLSSRGFDIESADLGKSEVRFDGSVARVQQALGVRFVSNGSLYANLNEPRIPASLSGSVVAFLGLDNLASRKSRIAETGAGRDYLIPGGTSSPHFGPQDMWHFYDETPPINSQGKSSGANGGTLGPDCIALLEYDTLPTVPSPTPTPAVPEDCSLAPAAIATDTGVVNTFTNQFCLPEARITFVYTDPSTPPGQPSDNEPNLDVDWAHAIAPNTPIKVYVATIPHSTTPALDTLRAAVTDPRLCGAISSSIDDRGAAGSASPCPSRSLIQVYEDLEARAVMQGQTVFHSSGDYGANYVCGQPGNQSGPTGKQPSIEESFASSDVTVVGGTEFQPEYDSDGNDVSVLTKNFEQVWQFATPLPTPVATPTKGASGGGISTVIPRPLWQLGIIPYGLKRPPTMRAVPDVSIAASGDSPGYWVATTNTVLQGVGLTCDDNNSTCFASVGGTSASSPVWAGISRLIAQHRIEQHLGSRFLGNINPQLYLLAALRSRALVDVSVPGSNCTVDSSGVCGTPNLYLIGPGYDLGTGLGSPDIDKLVAAFGFPLP